MTGSGGHFRLEIQTHEAHFKGSFGSASSKSTLNTPQREAVMTAIAFDTLKFAQTLRDKAKFTQEQSEGLANAIADATSDQLATKADIRDLKQDMREMEMRLEAKIDSKIDALRIDGLKWIVSAIGFQTIVLLGTMMSIIRFIGH